MYACEYVQINIMFFYECGHMYECMHICMYVCMYVYYVCMNVCICMYVCVICLFASLNRIIKEYYTYHEHNYVRILNPYLRTFPLRFIWLILLQKPVINLRDKHNPISLLA